MKHPLPEPFLSKQQALLGAEYPNFIRTYEFPASRGLRVNTLKVETKRFIHEVPFTLCPIPWIEEGFYYSHEDRPGKHPYHAAGVYYIQEPSAMAVVEVLQPQPHERVLDLAAAPGGKATQIAVRMHNTGLLVANEVHPTRTKALSENIERLGITNTIVTNESVSRLADRWPNSFDRIVLDAPCSGEGMFRKDDDARVEWSMDAVQHCSVRQIELLNLAAVLLKPGGRLVYSTCTFAPEENEQVIEQFLHNHPDWNLLPISHSYGWQPGRPEWSTVKSPYLANTARLWPHHVEGEGHFLALLEKGTKDKNVDIDVPQRNAIVTRAKHNKNDEVLTEAIGYLKQFLKDAIEHWEPAWDRLTLFGTHLYQLPYSAPSLDQVKVFRAGLHLGELKKNRFEPSHALALALATNHAKHAIDLRSDQAEVVAYLRGESIPIDSEVHGWCIVRVDGYALGWGKASQGTLKNHYPKGLRIKS